MYSWEEGIGKGMDRFEGLWSCISSGVGMFIEEGVSDAGLRYEVLDVGDPPARFSRTYMLDHYFLVDLVVPQSGLVQCTICGGRRYTTPCPICVKVSCSTGDS